MTQQNENTAIVAEEASVLSRWEAVAIKIADATEQSEKKEFDYRDKKGEKAARSWIAQLRKIKADVERARKEAKAVHIERGRRVDETAKLLTASVQGLIEPHESEIKAIEAEEAARVESHRAVLAKIAFLAHGVTSSNEAAEKLAELDQIDVSSLEEFAVAGQNAKAEAAKDLGQLYDSLLKQELEKEELENLRKQLAEKEEEEERRRIEVARQQGVEYGISIANKALESYSLDVASYAKKVDFQEREPLTLQDKKDLLEIQLAERLKRRNPGNMISVDAVISALVTETLHEAISIDWRLVRRENDDSVQW